jgi:hypothetical protein
MRYRTITEALALAAEAVASDYGVGAWVCQCCGPGQVEDGFRGLPVVGFVAVGAAHAATADLGN